MDISLLKAHSSHVNKVVFSPDSQYIASAGFSGELFLWDVESRERVQVYEGHKETVNGVCWIDDGQKFFSGSGDGTILKHEISKGEPIQKLNDLKSGVAHLRVTADENYLLTSTKSNMLTIWELPDGDKAEKVKSDQKNHGVLATAQHENHAIIGGVGSTIRRFNIPSGEVIEQLDGHQGATMGFRFFDEDRHAVSVGYDGKMIIWDMMTHQPLEKFRVGDDGYYGIDVSPDGVEVAISMPYQMKRISLSDLSFRGLDLPVKGNYSVAYAPNGEHIGIGSADKTVRLIPLEK